MAMTSKFKLAELIHNYGKNIANVAKFDQQFYM